MKLSPRDQDIWNCMRDFEFISLTEFYLRWNLYGNALNVTIKRLRPKVRPRKIYSVKGKGFSIRKPK